MKPPFTSFCTIIMFFALAVVTTSCEKESTPAGSTQSNYQLLLGTWTVQTIQYQQSNGTWINQSSSAAGEFSVTFSGNYYYSTLESQDYTNNNIWTLTGNTLGCNGEVSALFGGFTITQITTSSLDLTAVNYQNMPGFSYKGERLTFTKN